MLGKVLGLSLGLLCASQACFAQDVRFDAPNGGVRTRLRLAQRETLESGMTRLAARAAFHDPAPPTRQELLGVILLMSLRKEHGI